MQKLKIFCAGKHPKLTGREAVEAGLGVTMNGLILDDGSVLVGQNDDLYTDIGAVRFDSMVQMLATHPDWTIV